MLVPDLRIGTKEVKVLPVSNSRLELDTQRMREAEYRSALALGICVDGVRLNFGRVLVDEVAIAARLQDCGLELHPEKTKVVYCKDNELHQLQSGSF